jgi:ribosomal protein S18 acetylase RimI-like enzyme
MNETTRGNRGASVTPRVNKSATGDWLPAPPEVSIRPAEPEDSAAIAEIALAVSIYRYAYQEKGFLVYSLTAAEYSRRIADGQHVYVFMLDGRIIGFVCGYTKGRFESYLADGTLGHEPTIGNEVRRLASCRADHAYVFLDQIGVLPGFQDKGYGEACFAAFCAAVRGPYYVAMVEGPLPNPRIAFWKARGFQRIGVIEEPLSERFAPSRPPTLPNAVIMWGLYVLPEGGFRTQGR